VDVLGTLVPKGAVPVGPGPRDKLDELEKGNGAELEPVADVGGPVPVPIQEVPVGPRETAEELLTGNGAELLPVWLDNAPVPVGAQEVPLGKKPVEGSSVELDNGKGMVDAPDVEPVVPGPVVDAVPLVKGVPTLDDAEMGGPALSETPVELSVRVMVSVMVLTVVLPLTTKLLLIEAVMASTVDVIKTGSVLVVLSMTDEDPEVAAELGPTPVDV
jgi:hypothetical protein